MQMLLSIAELAELCGVAEKTVYMWRYRGYGPPAISLNGRVRYRAEDVQTWLDAQRERQPDAI